MKLRMYLLMCLLFSSQILFSQNNQDSTVISGWVISVEPIYPLVSDSEVENDPWMSEGLLYPTLVVNNMIITDSMMIDCFRNHFNKKKIVKKKWISEEKAQKMGIMGVSKDGAIIIRTKKRYYFDLQCGCCKARQIK